MSTYMPNNHASCALPRSGLACFGTSTTQGRLPALLKHAAVAGACGHLPPAAVNRVGAMTDVDLGLPIFCGVVAVGLNTISVCRCRCDGVSAYRMGGEFKRIHIYTLASQAQMNHHSFAPSWWLNNAFIPLAHVNVFIPPYP